MSAYPRRMSQELLGKLHRLAERRQAHVNDLQQSGRWKHYYNENEFAAVQREADSAADNWRRLASSRD